MKKKYVILFAAQTLVSLLILMYAFVKKAEADEQRKLADAMSRTTVQLYKRSEEMRKTCEERLNEKCP